MFKNRLRFLFLLPCVFLAACDGSNTASVNDSPLVSVVIPERIRSSQAVNLNATRVVVDTNTGQTIELQRNGDTFEGSIFVESGSSFSSTITIFEMVGGEEITYFRVGSAEQTVRQDFEVEVTFAELNNPAYYPDDDSDGFSNLAEREAGSNHIDSFSTPSNPDGQPPVATIPGRLQFTTDTYNVAEADGGLTISVGRAGGSDGRVSVRYELKSETAVLGRDFDASSGELIWEDGDATPKDIPVVVRTDDANDGEQTFTAHLFGPTGGVAIGNGFARITLADSTPPAQRGTIQMLSNSVTVDENAGQVEIQIERVNGSDGLVNVDYSTTAGTATEADFTAITQPRTIRWADGEDGPRTIVIPIANDAEVEPAETFTVNLLNTLGGASLGLATTSVVITDTTPVPVPGSLALAAPVYVVAEGASVDLVVERLAGSDGAATVEFIITSGTADDTDYAATNGTLSWGSGDGNPKSITITAIADTLLEADETLTVTLQNATGAALGAGSATVTISDATIARPGVIALGSSTASVDEGASIDVNVTRTGGSNGAVSVDVSAPASAEYTVSPANLTWADGDNVDKTVTITAMTDDVSADTETVNVQLTAATGGATLGPDTVIVTINDTTVPAGPIYTPVAEDGQWEVCIPPFNTTGPTAFATQLSANEGRIVSCIKTCDASTIIFDDEFAYTPTRERMNLALSTNDFTAGNSIWSCTRETRQNAEFNYVPDQTNTIWYQFLDDGTYFYSSTQDGAQPADLLGPDTWSVNGRILELGHIDTGYRNTLFFPGNQTLHIHPTTDDRLSCTRQLRVTAPVVAVPVVVQPVVQPIVQPVVSQ